MGSLSKVRAALESRVMSTMIDSAAYLSFRPTYYNCS